LFKEVIMIDPNLMARIRQRAYEIWEDEGRPEGRERIHWLRAEAEFRERLCASRFSNPGAKLRLQKSYEPPTRPTRTDLKY
jgi:hypothetical protein